VRHQICQFHIVAEVVQAVVGAVASARKGLAVTQPKLPKGQPSTPAAKAAARLKKRLAEQRTARRYRKMQSGADALTILSLPFGGAYLGLVHQELSGPPKFLTFLSTPTTLFVDPGRPSGSSPKHFLCVGFWSVKTIAVCLSRAHGAVSALESAVAPAVYVGPCVRFTCFVRFSPPLAVSHAQWPERRRTAGYWVSAPARS
jgi:hypothetical protein